MPDPAPSNSVPYRQRNPGKTPESLRWTLRPQHLEVALELERRHGLHPAVARVMAARGLASGDATGEFLSPRLATLHDPLELPDMAAAVERAARALERGEKLAVFGDYDVDGVSATAILVLTLRRLGADPMIIIPHRVNDGYGVTMGRIEELARAGVTLTITVDTGVTAVAEIAHARTLGMDVIVTDHHLADAELPSAVAVVNPNTPGAGYTGGKLCGAGVAFKFCHALLKARESDAAAAREFLRSLIDLVALGTIADVVPLLDENRVFARFGLEMLRDSPRPGIRALFAEARLQTPRVSSEHVGFVLAPRINAAGRTSDATLALELLLTDSVPRANEIAKQLETLNRRRREEEKEILGNSLEQAERYIAAGEDCFVVVAGESYHLGVVGIVASRLVERFHRPAIVMRVDEDIARGSARSIPLFNVREALEACDTHLVSFGGHSAAAGVRLRPANVGGFRTAINEYAREIFRTRDMTPEVMIDATVEPGEWGARFFDDLQRLQPFGSENPSPIFMMKNVTPSRPPRIVGQNHLRLSLQVGTQTLPAIGFGMGHLLTIFDSPDLPVNVLFRPSENTWQGQTTLELALIDARPA